MTADKLAEMRNYETSSSSNMKFGTGEGGKKRNIEEGSFSFPSLRSIQILIRVKFTPLLFVIPFSSFWVPNHFSISFSTHKRQSIFDLVPSAMGHGGDIRQQKTASGELIFSP